jgi:citrate lyase subunit alpha/citrate CoA-transferase
MKINGYKDNYEMFVKSSGNKSLPVIKPKEYNFNEKKLRKNLTQLLDELDLKDGMTLSFHHHLRNGDHVLNMVMEEIEKRKLKDLTLYASSIFPIHSPLVRMIENGTISQVYSAYVSGPVAKAISEGKMEKVLVMHTHGGRVRIIEMGEVTIDVAFIGAPTCDLFGNISGKIGKNACGAIGYAVTDAQYAKKSVAITDNIVEGLANYDIDGKYIDYILKVNSIGDAQGIVSGTTQITKNPIGLKIARLTTEVIKNSGYFVNGFSFQTGAGGISLAVAKYLKDLMKETNIKGSFASGGITSYLVEMLEEGYFEKLFDVQCFDLEAVRSIRDNGNHIPISASKYANINDDCVVNDLDFVILGATEIDLHFNVNVTTSSTGEIMGGSGGHSDTSYGSKVTIVVSQLFNARIPVIKDQVICKTTPGETVDVLVTERGIAINPLRLDLIERLKKTNLPLKTIRELKAISDELVGIPQEIPFTDQVIAVVEYRDGSVIDFIYKKAL